MEFLENKICLDTDFLVDFLRKKQDCLEFVAKHENSISLSTTRINLFELYYGAHKTGKLERIAAVDELQQRLWILELSQVSLSDAGKTAAVLEKSGLMIEFRDILIGCIAKAQGFALKTNNKKHFQRIPGLKVV